MLTGRGRVAAAGPVPASIGGQIFERDPPKQAIGAPASHAAYWAMPAALHSFSIARGSNGSSHN